MITYKGGGNSLFCAKRNSISDCVHMLQVLGGENNEIFVCRATFSRELMVHNYICKYFFQYVSNFFFQERSFFFLETQ